MVVITWVCEWCKHEFPLDTEDWYDEEGIESYECPICHDCTSIANDEHTFLQNLVKYYPDDIGLGKKFSSSKQIFPYMYGMANSNALFNNLKLYYV